MKRIFISMVLLLSMVAVHAQEENDEFTKEIYRNIELQNVTSNFNQILTQQMQPVVDKGLISAEKLSAMIKEVGEYASPLLKEKMASLYKEYFTLEELKQMNAYLSSPVGQKGLKLMPQFAAEGMKAMQTPEVQQKVQEIIMRYMKKE